MAVYGGSELALRSAETFNDMVSSSHSSWCLYATVDSDLAAFFPLRPREGRQATVLIMTWVKQLSPVLTFNLGNFNYASLEENFPIK